MQPGSEGCLNKVGRLKTRFVRLGEIAKHREEVGLIAKPQLDDFRMAAGGEGASLDEMASALALSSEDVAAVCFD
jgi:hypothetical protein